MTRVSVPEPVDAEAADGARRALEAAPTTGPTLALVSGGHDSLTALYVAYDADLVDVDGVVHVNTGIGIPETRQFVRQRTTQLGLDYYEVGKLERGADSDYRPAPREYRNCGEEYETIVRKLGFPGAALHKRVMYPNLKEKPLQKFLRATFPDSTPTLVSGVRRHESDRRMQNVDADGVGEYLGCTTISPLVEFRGIDVRRYRSALDLPMNPVVEKLEMSGECLCGAFSSRGELRMIRLFYPGVYRRILALEAKVTAEAHREDGPDNQYTRWGHNRLRDREQDAMTDDAQLTLCASCERRDECQNSDDGGGC